MIVYIVNQIQGSSFFTSISDLYVFVYVLCCFGRQKNEKREGNWNISSLC